MALLPGFLAFLCMGVMCIFSAEIVRRRCYDLFRAVHYLYIPALVCVVLHTSQAIVLLLGPVLLYVFDVSMRTYREYCREFIVTHLQALPQEVSKKYNVVPHPGPSAQLKPAMCMCVHPRAARRQRRVHVSAQ